MQVGVMTKTTGLLLIAGLVLIGSSMASLLTGPSRPSQTRSISAGGATLQIPRQLPRETIRGTSAGGSVAMGVKDDCDITYDQFLAVCWSPRTMPGDMLLPAAAYNKGAETIGPAVDLGNGTVAGTRSIGLSAVKPCGKKVKETLLVVDLTCKNSNRHFAVVALQDPYFTRERLVEIASSLRCP
jgi:hypothetical protein